MLYTKNDLKTLYEIDDHLWLEETIKLLKANRLDELDIENLIEELEYLSKKDRNKAVSLLEQVIRHLLLLQYWSEEYQNSSAHWKAEIVSCRTQLRRHLTINLRQHLEQELNVIYQDALRYVIQKTRLNTFPTTCPYTLEQLLNENWQP
ncbi:DUF29 domain-containing protein [Aphanothece hegewaldii CCALA 016]|uniref:DUF29 domain-containing protein n=1 Tax=Aphanothece hegewaldii CCALA 016 TaxID=2107694 RepID=A0A2T1LYG6_9CHRO|nr:DUF29 domain-containing protein [Aphanothece hegewaldii]PSF37436.1 DUF29 domain-containing protein [Aphanothece hegewaldii CCALA 016]